jgi:hypothetical protein
MRHIWADKRAKHNGGCPEAVGRRSLLDDCRISQPASKKTAAEKARKELVDKADQKKPKGELL